MKTFDKFNVTVGIMAIPDAVKSRLRFAPCLSKLPKLILIRPASKPLNRTPFSMSLIIAPITGQDTTTNTAEAKRRRTYRVVWCVSEFLGKALISFESGIILGASKAKLVDFRHENTSSLATKFTSKCY